MKTKHLLEKLCEVTGTGKLQWERTAGHDFRYRASFLAYAACIVQIRKNGTESYLLALTAGPLCTKVDIRDDPETKHLLSTLYSTAQSQATAKAVAAALLVLNEYSEQ